MGGGGRGGWGGVMRRGTRSSPAAHSQYARRTHARARTHLRLRQLVPHLRDPRVAARHHLDARANDRQLCGRAAQSRLEPRPLLLPQHVLPPRGRIGRAVAVAVGAHVQQQQVDAAGRLAHQPLAIHARLRPPARVVGLPHKVPEQLLRQRVCRRVVVPVTIIGALVVVVVHAHHGHRRQQRAVLGQSQLRVPVLLQALRGGGDAQLQQHGRVRVHNVAQPHPQLRRARQHAGPVALRLRVLGARAESEASDGWRGQRQARRHARRVYGEGGRAAWTAADAGEPRIVPAGAHPAVLPPPKRRVCKVRPLPRYSRRRKKWTPKTKHCVCLPTASWAPRRPFRTIALDTPRAHSAATRGGYRRRAPLSRPLAQPAARA